eukprot:3937145-Pleurochrysis_carterae.AAC.1
MVSVLGVRKHRLRLSLGAVVSADETFLNGERIGGLGSMYKGAVVHTPSKWERTACHEAGVFRSYAVPFLTLREGVNVVAVRVAARARGAATEKTLAAAADENPAKEMHGAVQGRAQGSLQGRVQNGLSRGGRGRVLREKFDGGHAGRQWPLRGDLVGGLVDMPGGGDRRVGPFDPAATGSADGVR